MLDDTGEGVLQGIIIDNYGNRHIVWIQILVVPTIGRDLFSVKKAIGKGAVSIFDHENSRLESFRATVPLREEHDDLYLFTLDLSAGGYGRTELAMNIASKVRIWHRRLRHPNERKLEPMQWHDGSEIDTDGTIVDCDVRAVGTSCQLSHPKKTQHTDIIRVFQLFYGNVIGPFTLEAFRGLPLRKQDYRPVRQMDRLQNS